MVVLLRVTAGPVVTQRGFAYGMEPGNGVWARLGALENRSDGRNDGPKFRYWRSDVGY